MKCCMFMTPLKIKKSIEISTSLEQLRKTHKKPNQLQIKPNDFDIFVNLERC